jgi:hypothetical protein
VIKEARAGNRSQQSPDPDIPDTGCIPYSPSALTPDTQALFRLPPTVQENINLDSMVNWAPIYIPLFDHLKPRAIVEIGVGGGDNTRQLVSYCESRGAVLYIVDTHLAVERELLQYPHVKCYEGRSVDFLKDFAGAEIYLIDGDHNYHTVSAELHLIEQAYRGDEPLLVLVHDTGWPWGIRDLFYNPATIDAPLPPVSSTKGPLPWKKELDRWGFWAGGAFYAEKEGGEKNGVRRAVEDFVADHTGWRRAYYTPFYGIGFLWKENSFSEEASRYMEQLIETLDRVEPIFATLEWNRVMLYIHGQWQGQIWLNQQKRIAYLEKRLREANVSF